MVKKHIMVIRNTKEYPEASAYLNDLGNILAALGFCMDFIDASDEGYFERVTDYAEAAETVLECKAVISCNGVGLEAIPQRMNCLFVVYLDDKYSIDREKMALGNKNTVLFLSDAVMLKELKEMYPNVGDVLYVDGSAEDAESKLMAQTQMAFDIQELIALKQGTPSVLKLLIQKGFESQQLEQVRKYLDQYKSMCPADMEVISMETMYALYTGDIETAFEYAQEGIYQYPCNGDMHYNLAVIYEMVQEWYLAWKEYGKAFEIYLSTKDDKADKLELRTHLQDCKSNYEKNPSGAYADMNVMLHKGWGLKENAFRGIHEEVTGNYFWETESIKRYVGIYKDMLFRKHTGHEDLLHRKGEFLEVEEKDEFRIPTEYEKYLLPIATKTSYVEHRVLTREKEHVVCQVYDKHFNYYRLPGGTQIKSSENVYYGKPIPLRHGKDKKKLVLNIFLDGLAQCEIEGELFSKNMPHTAKFFEKGMVCTRVYSTSEWTYPSIATYVTGLDTEHHMLFNGGLECRLPEHYPTLAEYFQEKGYYTAMLNGDWRIIPTCGHARGYDQYIYQHQWSGYKAEMLIGEVIDQIETFKDTDQFLWVSIGDLHDIADGLEMPHMVQSRLELEECVVEKIGPTSVKQEYSEIKMAKYRWMMKRIDILLNALYTYLEENYADDEVIVSLFADHGQGYLVPDGGHFLAKERTNVAFMFRGADIESCITGEIMSTADYIQIMCKLAGIEMKDIKIDGVLPKVFGGNGREYAFTQSIHQNDPYYAAIYSEDSGFYFTNPYGTQDDGRFYLKRWNAKLTDAEDVVIEDEERYNKYLKIIEEKIAPMLVYE